MGLAIRSFTPLLLATAAVAAMAAPAAAQRTFYVHFDRGNDAADGRTPATAWKRAPGDALAQGVARATALQPGDTVLFAGGVRYRGQIDLRRDGTAEQPIVFDGSRWGNSKAIMDGGAALAAAEPCPSQQACLGAAGWRQAMRVRLPEGTRWSDWLFDRDRPLQLAQWPAVDSYWNYDDVEQFAMVPMARAAEVQSGFLPHSGVPGRLAQGTPILGLWHAENDIVFARNPQFGADGVRFTPPRHFQTYTRKDSRFTVYNAPSEVDQPGEFAISEAEGVAVFIPHSQAGSGRMLTTGTRRAGFIFLGTRAHTHIRGFSFANFSSDEFGIEGGGNLRHGAGIYSDGRTTGVRVLDNDFRAMVNMRRVGVVRFTRAVDLEIKRNSFRFLPWSTAVYVADSPGPVRIHCNRVADIGRNGIRMLSALVADVAGNHVSGINGIHGTGINGYIDNRDLTIRDNVVVDAVNAIALHGARTPVHADPRPQNIVIRNNTLIGNSIPSAAVSSWGFGLSGVTMENNLIAGLGRSLRFRGDETNVVLRNNQLVGSIAAPRGFSPVMIGNQSFDPNGNGALLMEQARTRTPPASYCS